MTPTWCLAFGIFCRVFLLRDVSVGARVWTFLMMCSLAGSGVLFVVNAESWGFLGNAPSPWSVVLLGMLVCCILVILNGLIRLGNPDYDERVPLIMYVIAGLYYPRLSETKTLPPVNFYKDTPENSRPDLRDVLVAGYSKKSDHDRTDIPQNDDGPRDVDIELKQIDRHPSTSPTPLVVSSIASTSPSPQLHPHHQEDGAAIPKPAEKYRDVEERPSKPSDSPGKEQETSIQRIQTPSALSKASLRTALSRISESGGGREGGEGDEEDGEGEEESGRTPEEFAKESQNGGALIMSDQKRHARATINKFSAWVPQKHANSTGSKIRDIFLGIYVHLVWNGFGFGIFQWFVIFMVTAQIIIFMIVLGGSTDQKVFFFLILSYH